MPWLALIGTCIASSVCREGGDPVPAASTGPAPAADRRDPPARARGRGLFLAHCVPCHGVRADGQGVESRDLSRRPPSFRSPAFLEPGARARVQRALEEGVPGSTMPPWRHLGPGALRDLAEYVLSVPEQGP